jgi:hypothetical protein
MTDGYGTPPQEWSQAPAAASYDAPQAPRPKRTGLIVGLIVGGVILGLMACCAAVFIGFALFGGSSAEPWTLSADQKRVVQEFGPPQTFSIVCATDPTHDKATSDGFPVRRIETWTYHDLGQQFFFRDGAALGTTATPVAVAGTGYPKLKPEEFYRGMSIDDVVKAVGAAPAKAADIAPDTYKGIEMYVFADQVLAGFEDGKLVVLRTAPAIPEGGTP